MNLKAIFLFWVTWERNISSCWWQAIILSAITFTSPDQKLVIIIHRGILSVSIFRVSWILWLKFPFLIHLSDRATYLQSALKILGWKCFYLLSEGDLILLSPDFRVLLISHVCKFQKKNLFWQKISFYTTAEFLLTTYSYHVLATKKRCSEAQRFHFASDHFN